MCKRNAEPEDMTSSFWGGWQLQSSLNEGFHELMSDMFRTLCWWQGLLVASTVGGECWSNFKLELDCCDTYTDIMLHKQADWCCLSLSLAFFLFRFWYSGVWSLGSGTIAVLQKTNSDTWSTCSNTLLEHSCFYSPKCMTWLRQPLWMSVCQLTVWEKKNIGPDSLLKKFNVYTLIYKILFCCAGPKPERSQWVNTSFLKICPPAQALC